MTSGRIWELGLGIRWRLRQVIALGLLAVGGVASAQERPDEDALFGGPSQEGAADAGTAASEGRPDEDTLFGGEAQPSVDEAAAGTPVGNVGPPTGGSDRDAQVLEGPPIVDRFASEEEVEDPLRIGGLFYVRSIAAYAENESFRAVGWSMPTLVDMYFDARPSDRLRAFVSGRMTFDPGIDPDAASAADAIDPEGGVTDVGQNLFGGREVENPRVLLDQAWLRFDVARAVFLTVGKQHVKWGTGRFWNPTDFLSPRPRNPLQVFDVRTGASMVKVHVPWEKYGWNFYAIGLLDNLEPANVLGEISGAFRAEVVLGTAELGADAVFRLGRRPRFGLDVSAPLGPFDAYAEVALRGRPDAPLWRRVGTDEDGIQPSDFERFTPEGPSPQATGGLSYTWAYSENETVTFGGEYFYNSLGTDDAKLYPWLLFNGEFTPFYLGRHYAGAFAVLAGPGSWDNTSFVLSTLGNLSDLSFVSRLDVTQRVLTYLSVEGFLSVHYGNEGGEFRLGFDLPPTSIGGFPIPAIYVPAPVFEVGAALRLSI